MSAPPTKPPAPPPPPAAPPIVPQLQPSANAGVAAHMMRPVTSVITIIDNLLFI